MRFGCILVLEWLSMSDRSSLFWWLAGRTARSREDRWSRGDETKGVAGSRKGEYQDIDEELSGIWTVRSFEPTASSMAKPKRLWCIASVREYRLHEPTVT